MVLGAWKGPDLRQVLLVVRLGYLKVGRALALRDKALQPLFEVFTVSTLIVGNAFAFNLG